MMHSFLILTKDVETKVDEEVLEALESEGIEELPQWVQKHHQCLRKRSKSADKKKVSDIDGASFLDESAKIKEEIDAVIALL